LRASGCRRNISGIRENPMPAGGVTIWYENKEAALQKGREDGGANRSPRNSPQDNNPAREAERRERQGCQAQARAQTKCAA
jgi:hypothetical protein